MKIYDISQPVFECCVIPGDPAPEKKVLLRTETGGVCNLTAFSMCAHNGTHVDAPFHFLSEGKTIGEVDMDRFVGEAYVTEALEGDISAEKMQEILEKAKSFGEECAKRILLKGKGVVTIEAAKVLAEEKVKLIGNDSQTVGPENAPKAVHLVLLAAEVVLLEGTRLDQVPEGRYLLNSAPINLGDIDGAPCRAILMSR